MINRNIKILSLHFNGFPVCTKLKNFNDYLKIFFFFFAEKIDVFSHRNK